MAANLPWPPLVVEAAQARPHHHDAGQRAPAADAVDHGGAGEVDKPESRQPAVAVPGPVAEQRVDQPGDQHGAAQIPQVAGAFRHRPGRDGGGGGGEHQLEQQQSPQIAVALAGREQVLAHPAAGIDAEHQAEAQRPEHQRPHAQVHVVLHHHVDGVLGAAQAAFEKRETGLHKEHQGRRDGDPDHVVGGIFRGVGQAGGGQGDEGEQ